MPNKKEAFVLSRFLPYRLVNTAEKTSMALSKIYSDQFNLSIPEWRIMATLGAEGGLTAKQLSDRTQMNKVTVSRAIARLSDKKHLVKEGDPADGRVIYLSLSSAGKSTYKKLIPRVLDWEARFTENLSKQELEQLHSLFSKLQKRLSDL